MKEEILETRRKIAAVNGQAKQTQLQLNKTDAAEEIAELKLKIQAGFQFDYFLPYESSINIIAETTKEEFCHHQGLEPSSNCMWGHRSKDNCTNH